MATAARRRYNRSALMLAGAYVAILIGVTLFFKNAPRGGLSAYAAAVLPALPIVGIFFVIGRYLVEESDEYVRMLMVRQTLWATGFALSIATFWGFLENFGLVPHVEAFYVAVLWLFGLALGGWINKLTIGDDGCC